LESAALKNAHTYWADGSTFIQNLEKGTEIASAPLQQIGPGSTMPSRKNCLEWVRKQHAQGQTKATLINIIANKPGRSLRPGDALSVGFVARLRRI